jgi:tetratricopeptide (TPR) repeat protein
MRGRFLPLLLLFAIACTRAETPREQPPVIVISIDTLRADRLPAYGYRGISTPAIDSLRADGILYSNAWSHAPMTLPAHASLLTGLLPYEHGVRNNLGYKLAGHDSIPAMLKRAGYATGGAVSAYVLRADTGVGPLFDFYDDDVSGATNVGIGEVMRGGFKTEEAASKWIGSQTGPFFFFLHLFEPHTPYDGSYDAEIVKSDAIVGRLLERLKASGVYDRALIVLLSDHGEGLGDHGEGEHGVFLYREVLRVPLIVKLPAASRRGTTIEAPVQLIDVMPTVSAITGATSTAKLAGASLLAPPASRRIYSETMLPRIHFGWSDLRSLVDEKHHFIDAPRVELYDHAADPAEKTNIAAEDRRTLADMRRAITGHASELKAPSNISGEEAEKLAALGYIGSVRSASGDLPDPKDRIADLEALKSARTVADFQAIIQRNPNFADAWLRMAALQERLGQLEEAIASYRSAINAAPVLATSNASALGSLYLRTGKLAEAEAHAKLANNHHLLGRVALARRDYATAQREAQLAMNDPLWRGPGAVLLAQVYVEQGRLNEALTFLQTAPPSRDLEATRGDILARMDRGEEAIAAFEKEIAAHPDNWDAHAKLALLYAAMGRDPRPILRRMPPPLAESVMRAMSPANRTSP